MTYLLMENVGMVHLLVPGKAGLNLLIIDNDFKHVSAGNYLRHFLFMRLLIMLS